MKKEKRKYNKNKKYADIYGKEVMDLLNAPKSQTELSKEYSGMSLSDIYHFEITKLTNPERRNEK